jgi:hypothetical protein
MAHWSGDDLRIIGDIVAGSLLVKILQLIAMKAFIEPIATRVGQSAYRRVDAASGDRLPDLFPPSKS